MKVSIKRQYEICCVLKKVYSFEITKDSETEAFNVGMCTGMHEDGFNTIGSIFLVAFTPVFTEPSSITAKIK